MTLLEQIQNEAVDGKSDLATVLRKCRVLAARLKNEEFTAWVKHELDGYREAEVPDYRILFGQAQRTFLGAMGHRLTNVPLLADDIDPAVRDDLLRIRLNAGVASLLAMLGRAQEQDGCFRVAWPHPKQLHFIIAAPLASSNLEQLSEG